MVTLFAVFGMYGDIWPTTVRYSEAECIAALRVEPSMREYPADLPIDELTDKAGIGLGSFTYGDEFFGTAFGGGEFPPRQAAITWVHGGWAEAAKREAGK